MNSREQFQILLDSIADYAIFILDAKGRVSSWSSAAEKMFGYTSADIQGQHFSCLYPPVDIQSGKPREEIQMAAVHGRFEDINWRVRRDGSKFWADSVLCPLRREDGKLGGFSQVIRDISERKKTQDLLRQKEEELSQARKLEAIGRLAGGVAHDFNNFMIGIIGVTDEVRLSLDSNDPRRADLEEIIKTAERAQILTRELLAFGRRQVAAPKVLNINAVIEEKRKILPRLLGLHIVLETDLDPLIGNILMDSAHLDQIIVNLVVNARDAMPQGGRLLIRTRRLQVKKEDTFDVPQGTYVDITISDTGTGIDENVLPRLFEPFFTTKQKGKGTGLGLATVYGIVKQNHGNISVESQPGKGTSFRVMLPEIDAPATIDAREEQAPQTLGGATILVAEDQVLVRRVVTSALEKRGYHILSAPSGSDALAIARKHGDPIHLLLTDVSMPGMTGPALAKEISALHPETAVLFMSGYAEDLMRERGMLDNGLHFIEKSFTGDSLAEKVNAVLRDHTVVTPS